MAGACVLARKRLTDFVGSLQKAGVAEKAGAGIKAIMLLGISAAAKGFKGNLEFGGARFLAEQPLEAGIDYLVSLGKSASTGFKVPTHEFREVVNGLDWQGAKAYGRGIARGAGDVRAAHRGGMAAAKGLPQGTPWREVVAAYADEASLRLAADAQKIGMNNPTTKIQSPVGRTVVKAAFGAVEAVDRPAFEGALDASLYMQSKLSAVRQGLKSSDPRFDAEVQRLMAAPTDEMLARSMDDAIYVTFKGKSQIAQKLEQARRSLQLAAADPKATTKKRLGSGALSLAMDVTVPFTGVPSDILNKAVARTPLGFVGAAADAVAMAKGEVGAQAAFSRSLGNATAGSGLIYLGYQWAREGKLRGAPSSSSNERADESMTGDSYSYKVNGQWVNISDLGPHAIPLAVGAALAKKQERDPSANALDLAGAGAGSIGKSLVETSFMQGTKRMIEGVQDPENKMGAVIAGALPIPALAGQLTRAIDGQPREAMSTGDKVLARTPLGATLPEKGTPLGAAEPRTGLERIAPLLGMRITKDRDTPEMAEVRRLGLSVGMPERKTSINNQSVEIPREVYGKMLDAQGDRVLPAIRRLMADSAYIAVDDEEKKRRLRITIQRQKDAARNPIRRDIRSLLKSTP